MNVFRNKLSGVFEIRLTPRIDERGYFIRTFDKSLFQEAGLDRNWVQENHSRSLKKGIVRGLHFQFPPFAETKLVRCSRGAIYDVFVDLRERSETFGQWGSIELSESNANMILIPRGFAHGFCTLTDDCDVLYKVDNFYTPESEAGIIWNDPSLEIPWPVDDPIISLKDSKNLSIKDFIINHQTIKL